MTFYDFINICTKKDNTRLLCQVRDLRGEDLTPRLFVAGNVPTRPWAADLSFGVIINGYEHQREERQQTVHLRSGQASSF